MSQYELPLDTPLEEEFIQVELIRDVDDPNKPAISIWEDGSYSMYNLTPEEAVALLASFTHHIIGKYW